MSLVWDQFTVAKLETKQYPSVTAAAHQWVCRHSSAALVVDSAGQCLDPPRAHGQGLPVPVHLIG